MITLTPGLLPKNFYEMEKLGYFRRNWEGSSVLSKSILMSSATERDRKPVAPASSSLLFIVVVHSFLIKWQKKVNYVSHSATKMSLLWWNWYDLPLSWGGFEPGGPARVEGFRVLKGLWYERRDGLDGGAWVFDTRYDRGAAYNKSLH